MSVYANEGFYALAGFAKVVGAIDGSLMSIIAPINVSVHQPHETINRVDPPPPVIRRHVPSLFFVFLLFFVAFGQSVHFIFNSNSDALHHAAVALSDISDLMWLVITLPNNSLLLTLSNLLNLPHICILITRGLSTIITNDNVDFNVMHVFAEDTHAVYN